MFLGESLTIFAYLYYKYRQKNKPSEEVNNREDDKPEVTPWIILIPAMCDLVGSTLTFLALTMMAGSVYQMVRGAIVFITALFSILFLKSKLYRHHVTSLVVVFIGIFLVGLASQIYHDPDKPEAETRVFGIIMLVVSLFFNGFQFIAEEMIMNKYKAHPLQMVGWEGIWGLSVYVVLLIIFSFIPCGEVGEITANLCTVNEDGEYYVETAVFALRQIVDNTGLLFLVIGGIFSIAFFNFFGISLTKYVSASSRAVVDNSRTIIVWLFFLVVPTVYQENFKALQFVGFIVTIIGALCYNEIIVIPVLGFNMYTKDAIKERKLREQMITQDPNEDLSLGIGLGKENRERNNSDAKAANIKQQKEV